MEENKSYYENLFINADAFISENKITEAKELLEELLIQNPSYGRAHNHMGWLFHHKLQDLEKAKMHLYLAIKFEPSYAPSYLNLAYILADCKNYDEAIKLLEKAVNDMPNISQSACYSEMGRIFELTYKYDKAIINYKLAKKNAINNAFIDDMNASISRVKNKMNIFDKLKQIFK